MEKYSNVIEKLKQSTLFKAIAAYAIFAFIIVQVASLVSDTFELNQQFMKNLIWVFVIGFPFLAIVAWASSSRFSTFKILGIFLLVFITGYGSGSYLWVNTFMMPQIKNAPAGTAKVTFSFKISISTSVFIFNKRRLSLFSISIRTGKVVTF